jgi:hypothetical protein
MSTTSRTFLEVSPQRAGRHRLGMGREVEGWPLPAETRVDGMEQDLEQNLGPQLRQADQR